MPTDDAAEATAYRPFTPFSAWADVLVGSAWEEFMASLEAARNGVEPAVLTAALDIAVRSAALETGAIEGLYTTTRGVTRTVALQAAMWEAELEKLGSDVRGHFEAQLAAFELVLDIATKHRPVTEAWLRDLHATACAAQATYKVWTGHGWQEQALPRGEYKTQPNNVTLADRTVHWYAPVLDVPSEMHRLIEEMRSDSFEATHPVLQAAFAHHALTAVHPFADGNGRAARALASVFLYRSAGVPLLIFSDQQERYWDALAEADLGRNTAFASFIDDRAIDTMALVTDRLREASDPLERRTADLRARFRSHGGFTHAEVHSVGTRLTDLVERTFHQEYNHQSADLQPDVFVGIAPHPDHTDCTFWDQPYHPLVRGGRFTFILSCQEPLSISIETTPIVGIANDIANPFSFIVIDANRETTAPLKLRVTDLHPAIAASAEARITSWVKQAITTAVRDLQRAIDGELGRQGYAVRRP